MAVEADGLAAERVWAAGAFAAVILDVMLPGLDGIGLCARRRSEGDTTPVLLLTARDDDTTRRSGQQAGASAFLTKPYAYGDLLSVLEGLMPAAGGTDDRRSPRSCSDQCHLR